MNAENSADTENAKMLSLSFSVLENIRDKDFRALQNMVHPELGVTFSPYATISPTTDRHLTAAQVARLGTDTNVYIWGVYNGSGEPIELSTEEFFVNYIKVAEFIDSTVIGINRIIRSGNALENIAEIYPDAKFVDFHVSRGEPTDETDWSSLRLCFKEYNGNLRLIAIIYSSWTV